MKKYKNKHTGGSLGVCALLAKGRGATHFSFNSNNGKCEIPKENAETQCEDDLEESGNYETYEIMEKCCQEMEVVQTDMMCSKERSNLQRYPDLESCRAANIAEGNEFFSYKASNRRCYMPLGDMDAFSACNMYGEEASGSNVYRAGEDCNVCMDVFEVQAACKCSSSRLIEKNVRIHECRDIAIGEGKRYFSYRDSNGRCELSIYDDEWQDCVLSPQEDENFTIYEVDPACILD